MTGGKRHIGYVLKRFPRISETFVAAEVIELERLGEQVTIFAVSRPDEPFAHEFLQQLSARVVYLPHRLWREPGRVVRATAACIRRSPGGFLRAAAAVLLPPRIRSLRRLFQAAVLVEEMRAAGIDHAHAHFATTAARLVNLAWHMDGVTYSVTAHAKDIYHEEVKPSHLRGKLRGARFVATVSQANREYLAGLLHGDGHVLVVPNSVDVRRLAPASSRPARGNRVLTVARLVEKKGIGDLVEACGLLTRRDVPVVLEIVGDGPQRSVLEQRARRVGAQVVFHGALPHQQVLERLWEAHIFCLPCVIATTGDRDGLPTSVLEAMAVGVPVVTTDVNGLADVVEHERTGLVVPQREPVELAAAIERLLADPQFAADLAAAARERVEAGFSLERSAALLQSLFPAPAGL